MHDGSGFVEITIIHEAFIMPSRGVAKFHSSIEISPPGLKFQSANFGALTQSEILNPRFSNFQFAD